jgi:hypothetical protein
VNAEPAITDDFCDFVDPDLARILDFESAPRDVSAIVDREYDCLEETPVVVIKGQLTNTLRS